MNSYFIKLRKTTAYSVTDGRAEKGSQPFPALLMAIMRRSIRKFNIPPGQPPGHLNFWSLVCSNSLPSGQESCSNAPPISTELPLLKDKFSLLWSTFHAFQREICRNDTFNLLLKTLFKELFTNKGGILSCKSVRPRKNRKNSQAYYVRTRDKSGSNSPPFQRNVQIPPSPGTMYSQIPGECPGGMLKFRIDRRIKLWDDFP